MKRFVLPFILLLAFVLRVIWLDKYPVGFTPDEASFGYDAYSILTTGKDQWGKSFPLVLESFGDFKSPLYAYLTIPSVAVFGLNKFAVRLPSAIFGTLAVMAAYLLASKLFDKKTGLFAGLLLAISPWHVMLSRGAFEANLTTFFLPFGLWLFLEKRYTLSGIILGLNLFTYHSAKLITPLVFVAVILYSRENIKRYWPAIAAFGIFLILTFYALFLGGATRASERSITQGAAEDAFSERIKSSVVFHNKYIVIAERFVKNYVTYFSPQFLFTQGPGEGTYGMIPGIGVLYLFTIPFLIFTLKKKLPGLLLFWVLVSPIPASLATGVGYHANRAVGVMPAIDIILALGAVEFFSWLKNKRLLVIGYNLFIAVSAIFFLEGYFIQSPYKVAGDMLYGNLEVAQWVAKNIPSGQKVVVSRSLSEPHIYFAFASGFDPDQYQKATTGWDYRKFNTSWVDQIPIYSLGRFTFINIKDYKSSGIIVGKPEEFPEGVIPLTTISYPGGKPAVFVVEAKP